VVVYRHQKRLSSGVSDEGIARQEAAFEEVPEKIGLSLLNVQTTCSAARTRSRSPTSLTALALVRAKSSNCLLLSAV